MPDCLNEVKDQRKNTSMEDSNAMTIEFLRARLLSERSVSKTARQRANELAKRVVELEEQLKFVSLQRKKAEKATEDVLTILENHGISDGSDAFDSSSDQEATHSESRVSNGSVKEEETSANGKVRRNDVEAFSGSEHESSPLSGRSLSWKSSKESPHSLEKKRYMDSSRRNRSSFGSNDSSSPKRVGKSCRQIRRKETRSAVEELQRDTRLALQVDEVATCSECFPNCSDIEPEALRKSSQNHDEKDLLEGPISRVLVNQIVTNGHYCDGHERDKDMEKALEHQAQLIGRYEAEEKAQREWEEKFRENNSCTPDSCDPGNHSDVTEERDEIKAPAPPRPAGTIASRNQESNLGAADVCFSEESKTANAFHSPPQGNIGCLQDLKRSSMIAYESPASEFAFSMAKRKHDGECCDNNQYPPLHSPNHFSDSHGTTGNHSATITSLEGSSLGKGEASGSTNELALMPHETCDKLGSVLEALQQAKISLKQKLDKVPLLEGGSAGKAIEPSVPAVRTEDRLQIPVGYSGLFRLPTDFQFEATTQASFQGSGSQLSLANYSPQPAGDKFFTGPYMDSRSSTSADDRFLTIPTSPYREIRSGVPTRTPIFEPGLDAVQPYNSRYTYPDPHLSAGLPSSRKYTYPTYPTYPVYPDLMPQMPSNEGLTRSLPSREVGIPPATQFSFYDDHARPNMYR